MADQIVMVVALCEAAPSVHWGSFSTKASFDNGDFPQVDDQVGKNLSIPTKCSPSLIFVDQPDSEFYNLTKYG